MNSKYFRDESNKIAFNELKVGDYFVFCNNSFLEEIRVKLSRKKYTDIPNMSYERMFKGGHILKLYKVNKGK